MENPQGHRVPDSSKEQILRSDLFQQMVISIGKVKLDLVKRTWEAPITGRLSDIDLNRFTLLGQGDVHMAVDGSTLPLDLFREDDPRVDDRSQGPRPGTSEAKAAQAQTSAFEVPTPSAPALAETIAVAGPPAEAFSVLLKSIPAEGTAERKKVDLSLKKVLGFGKVDDVRRELGSLPLTIKDKAGLAAAEEIQKELVQLGCEIELVPWHDEEDNTPTTVEQKIASGCGLDDGKGKFCGGPVEYVNPEDPNDPYGYCAKCRQPGDIAITDLPPVTAGGEAPQETTPASPIEESPIEAPAASEPGDDQAAAPAEVTAETTEADAWAGSPGDHRQVDEGEQGAIPGITPGDPAAETAWLREMSEASDGGDLSAPPSLGIAS